MRGCADTVIEDAVVVIVTSHIDASLRAAARIKVCTDVEVTSCAIRRL